MDVERYYGRVVTIGIINPPQAEVIELKIRTIDLNVAIFIALIGNVSVSVAGKGYVDQGGCTFRAIFTLKGTYFDRVGDSGSVPAAEQSGQCHAGTWR